MKKRILVLLFFSSLICLLNYNCNRRMSSLKQNPKSSLDLAMEDVVCPDGRVVKVFKNIQDGATGILIPHDWHKDDFTKKVKKLIEIETFEGKVKWNKLLHMLDEQNLKIHQAMVKLLFTLKLDPCNLEVNNQLSSFKIKIFEYTNFISDSKDRLNVKKNMDFMSLTDKIAELDNFILTLLK